MTEKLLVANRPCNTCPYRCDTPSGVWAVEEYLKLPGYDNNTNLGTFLCHQTNATGRTTVCRGWLSVHAESVAARMAVLNGSVTDEERLAPSEVELYPSGLAAGRAGLKGVRRPSREARASIDRLARSRAGHV